MKILIIGSEGFIGKNLVKYLKNNNEIVIGCDIIKNSSCEIDFYFNDGITFEWYKLFEKEQFDFCINAGGNANVSISFKDNSYDYIANVTLTRNILDAIQKYNPKCKYIHLSSAAVYGNPKEIPINESSAISPISPYGWHKYISEILCKEYNNLYGIQSIILRPFSVFGPGLRKQIFWDVFQKYQNNHKTLELWGEGTETRDYIYIDEFVSIIHHLMNHSEMNASIYNIASGNEMTIKNAVSIFFKQFNPQPELLFLGKQDLGNPLNWRADISKLKNTGYTFKHDFLSGIESTAKWLQIHG